MMKNTGLLQFAWRFVRPRRCLFLGIFLFSFMWAIDATAWPYIIGLIIDVLSRFDSDRTASAWSALVVPVGSGMLLWLGLQLGFCAQGLLIAKMLPKFIAEMRLAMFDHVQRHSPRYFNEHFAGSLANKISDMTTQMESILKVVFTIFTPAFGSFLLGTIFFLFVNPWFAAVLIVWYAIHFSICILFARKCEWYESVHGEVRSSLIGKMVDSLTNNFVVNLFFRFKFEKNWISSFQKEEEKKSYEAKRYIEVMRFVIGMEAFLIGGLLITGFTLYLWFQGSVTTGEVVQILNTTGSILVIMWVTGFEFPNYFQSVGIARQALSVMNDPQDIEDLPGARPLVISRGEILFNNVSFHYGEKRLFSNKSVHIRSNERVGLVGYSGAGKSTFVNLILRFFPIESGEIFIDGQEISHVTLESLRSQVALIPQDPLLFHRTLRENIGYGNPEATEEQVIRVAKLAHCDEFIQQRPEGYRTLVGERGTKLSGGERQRIAIARAMLSNAPILILDEATSALDSITENLIQESLDLLMEKRTTIVIAHRLSTLARMDRILVFDQGKIIEEGTHQALLSQGGHYARMWKMQAGGFLPESPKEN